MSKFRSRHRKLKPIETTSTRAAIYCRVSTLSQSEEGVSLDAQEARLRAFATAVGLDLVAVLREEAVSGTVPLRERPEGAKLVALIEAGDVQHVLAVKLDRLFRNASDASETAKRWEKRGVSLKLLDMGGQPIDTASPVGKFLFLLLAGVAELERDQIASRTRMSLAHKKAKGEACGRSPRGTTILDKKLVIADPAELAVYRRACELKATGDLTYAEIADQLRAEGFVPRGRKFWPAQIHRWTNNPRLAELHPA